MANILPSVTVTAILEETTYRATEIVPSLSAGLAIAFGVLLLVVSIADRGLRNSVTLLPAAGAALLAWMALRDPGYFATAGDLFSARYSATAACAGAGAAGIALGIAAMARFRLSGAARTRVSSHLAVGASILGAVFFAASVGNRLSLGDPRQALPCVVAKGSWRGHAGFARPLEAVLAAPNWESHGFLNLQRAFVPRVVSETESKLRGWSCDTCQVTIPPSSPGEHTVTVRGLAGRITFEQELAFTAIEESGNPLWPLRVGERHVFGLAHHERGREGGWAVAISAGMKHLKPEHGAIHVDDGSLSVSVVRTEMREGFRHFVLDVRDAKGSRTLRVMADGGETWLVPEDGRKRVPFVSTFKKGERSGLFVCHFAEEASLPLNTCASGTDPSAPVAGPVSGTKSAERSTGQELGATAAALLTFGMIVPGNGAYEEYCYQSASPGTGESMPVAPSPPGDSDPFIPQFVACPPR
jgi:hypothetical protein